MPKPDELPLDLAHLDDLREKITEADEAIVSFICLRVQLGREELAYRRERGLPEWDRNFAHREWDRLFNGLLHHVEPLSRVAEAEMVATGLMNMFQRETGAVDDGRVDPATDAIPY